MPLKPRHRKFPLGALRRLRHQPLTGRTSNGDTPFVTYPMQSISPVPDPPTSSATTPDPTSPMDYYASQSSPSLSSPERILKRSSLRTPGTMILERLDELLLGHGLRGPAGSALVDDPPRKLLLSSQVLQVANSNTVKDHFPFLFNDHWSSPSQLLMSMMRYWK